MYKFYIIIGLCLFTFSLSAQKLITTINTTNRVEGYSFKYDRHSGSYVYNDYDTTTKKSVLITPKGSSAQYDFEMVYSSVFDNSGNSYTVAYNQVHDTDYIYFLLKNNIEAASFDFIGDGWDINNGVLYFYVKEGSKYYFIAYNTLTGEISKGRAYDEIYLANFIEEYYEGEPQGKVGFTNEGKPFYLAVNNDEKFFVFGTEEQKHYSDIDWYMTKKDNKGELVYIAKSKGKFYVERGNAFLVQGNKEYKPFDYVSGPVIFDKNNNPVYVAMDSAKEWDVRSRIMIGDKEGKIYDGSIFEYKYTPSGKLAYVVSERNKKTSKDENIYDYFLVINKSEGKHYNAITNPTFSPAEEPVFIAANKSNRYFVVQGNKVISEKYDNIYDYSYMNDGSLAYIGNFFGNYETQEPDKHFVHIKGKKYGPYEFISMADYTSGKYIVTDDKNNFAFITSKLVSPKDYIYKYKVITNKGESSDFDAIDIAKIINGKTVYVAGENIDRENYKYNYSLYIDNKAAAGPYDNIIDVIYDKTTGTLSMIANKDNNFYLIEFSM